MKIIAALCIATILFNACHNAPDNGAKQDSTQSPIKKDSNAIESPFDTMGLFRKLYPNGKIVRTKAIENSLRLIVSSGEDYFANIDDIIKIPGNGNKYAIVFTVFSYTDDGQRDESRASIAIYDIALVNNSSGFCKIENFCRNFDTTGSFGLGGLLTLENLGKEEVLHVSSGYGVEGEVYNREDYYALDSTHLGKSIFTFESSYSNDGNYEFDSASGILQSSVEEPLCDYKVQVRKLVIVPTANGQWDALKLNCKFTRYDSLHHKMNDSAFTENYQMNEGRNRYEKVVK